MSFGRFLEGDVYVFEHVSGHIECCACFLAEEAFSSFEFKTPREALAHLEKHKEAGHDVAVAEENIKLEYPDLDVVIQPYKKPAED